jgi:phosphatidylglycerol:prolipoprotein diacylglycerol transferase
MTKNTAYLSGVVVAAVLLGVAWFVTERLEVESIPVYGYGLMLFFAFIFCNLLARRLCTREGIDPNIVPDLAIWLFVSGIVGGRLVFVIQYWNDPEMGFAHRPLSDVVKLWDGGLVLYGAIFGGLIGFLVYYHRSLREQNVSLWKLMDVIAPCIALGVALGRIGCLFTGCCYGNVACEGYPGIQFPVPAAGWKTMVTRGYQTPFGFLLRRGSLVVEAVEPGSNADEVLKPNDVIVAVNGKEVLESWEVAPTNGVLHLKVSRAGQLVELPAFVPRSIPLNPTQPYETISMLLILFLLLSYYPFKTHDGAVLVLLMLCYAVHRFLNEMLRTDTDPVAFGLTLSQNISIGILAAGVILGFAVWRRPPIGAAPPAPAATLTPTR